MERGKKIKQLREMREMSQTDASKLLGVSKQTLYKYENDVITNIPSDVIERMAKLYDSTPAYIMGWEQPNLLDAEDFIETNKTKVSKNELEAMKLYSAYKNATPEIQAAVEILLKGKSLDPDVPRQDSKTNG